MSFASLFIILFTVIPISDTENGSDPIVVVSMEVNLEIVSGSQLLSSFANNIEVSNSNQRYQVGFQEFTLSYSTATEVIIGTTSHNHNHDRNNICSFYFVAGIEKVDENTGVLRLHYLSSDQQKEEEKESRAKHVATIIYL